MSELDHELELELRKRWSELPDCGEEGQLPLALGWLLKFVLLVPSFSSLSSGLESREQANKVTVSTSSSTISSSTTNVVSFLIVSTLVFSTSMAEEEVEGWFSGLLVWPASCSSREA